VSKHSVSKIAITEQGILQDVNNVSSVFNEARQPQTGGKANKRLMLFAFWSVPAETPLPSWLLNTLETLKALAGIAAGRA
jgi:hypothetical protein